MGKKKWKKKASGRPASPTAKVVRIPDYSPPPVPAWQSVPIEEAEAYARKRMIAHGITPTPPPPVLKLEDLPADVKAQIDQQIAEGKTDIVVVLPGAEYGDVAAMAREIMEGGSVAPIVIQEARRYTRKIDAATAALALASAMPAPCGDDYPKPKQRRRFPIPR